MPVPERVMIRILQVVKGKYWSTMNHACDFLALDRNALLSPALRSRQGGIGNLIGALFTTKSALQHTPLILSRSTDAR